MNKIIFFDFDGVFFNTLDESFIVAYESFFDINSNCNINIDRVFYDKFKAYRYLIGPAWNYYYLFKSIASGEVGVEKKYHDLLKSSSYSDYMFFENKFFETREKLKNSNYDNWLKLNIPYDFFYKMNELKNVDKNNLFIVTTKDEETVKKILKIYDCTFIINKNILGKKYFEKYKSKAAIISEIINDFDKCDALFVDDLKEHLSLCENIKGLTLLQANWGYINKTDLYQNNLNIDLMIEQIKLFMKG